MRPRFMKDEHNYIVLREAASRNSWIISVHKLLTVLYVAIFASFM